MWIIVWISLLLLDQPAADQVELKGGTILQGKILARDRVGIDLELDGGQVLFLAADDVAGVGETAGEAPAFIRFHQAEAADALQTAWAIYRAPGGERVALAGAVHVADARYFEKLQARLDRYDVVLFEGVASSEEAADPRAAEKAQQRFGFIAQLQLEMGDLLDLTFQKDGIDYSRESFRNADLGWEELQGELGERGQPLLPMEGLLRLVSPILRWSMSAQKEAWERSGQKEKASTELKRRLAAVLGDADRFLARMGIHDPESRDDVLISVRNDAALEALDAALDEEGVRNAAIFYGAGHLPDLHRRLTERGFRISAWSWLDAWHLPK